MELTHRRAGDEAEAEKMLQVLPLPILDLEEPRCAFKRQNARRIMILRDVRRAD